MEDFYEFGTVTTNSYDSTQATSARKDCTVDQLNGRITSTTYIPSYIRADYQPNYYSTTGSISYIPWVDVGKIKEYGKFTIVVSCDNTKVSPGALTKFLSDAHRAGMTVGVTEIEEDKLMSMSKDDLVHLRDVIDQFINYSDFDFLANQ